MDQVRKFLSKLYRGVGSARAKRYDKMLGHRDALSLLQKESLSAPHVYHSPDAYRKDALVVEIIRKMLIPGDSKAREAAAVSTFWASEAQCAETNARLSRFVNLQGPFEAQDEQLIKFISRWRDNVRRVLGKAPAVLTPRFSGGSTLSDRDKRVTIPDKLTSEPTFYRGSQSDLNPHLNGTPFFMKDFRRVRSNRFFTVPKDSEKDRGCCVEASLAVSLQLDAGAMIIDRLEKRYKVNVKRLPEYHNWLAQLASRFGTFATIDLSNASDTVARILVKVLLPDDWWLLLNSLRASTTDIDGRTVWLEKFSSMGNGFTFPLETLLFRTLCEAVGSKCASVFGDDIVIESEHAKDLLAALKFFGFTPNAKKTFCEGPFRESCGGDFFYGQPVRAHYLKELPVEPQHWVSLANGLRRADPLQKWTRAAWHFCVDQLPLDWRNFTADPTLGDLAIYEPTARPSTRFSPWPERVYSFGRRVGDDAKVWKVKQPIFRSFSLTDHFSFEVVIVAASMGTPQDVVPRDSVIGYKTGYIRALS